MAVSVTLRDLPESSLVQRLDGWKNVLTGLGDGRQDKRLGSQFRYAERLDKTTLEEMYAGDSMAAKIIDTLPEDMCREWAEYQQDDDPDLARAVNQQIRDLGVQEAFEWGVKMSRLYGGSAVLLGADDGRDFGDPLDENNIRSIKFLNVLDRWQLWPTTQWYRDPRQPKYGQVEMFRFQPVFGAEAIMAPVHESRLLLFRGIKMPDRMMLQDQMWGRPVLDRLYNALRNFHSVHDSSATIVSDFAQAVYKLKDLASALANAGTAGEQAVITRLKAIEMGRSIMHAIVLDENESFSKLSTTTTGLGDLIAAAERRLTAETSLPHSRLLGESPGASLGEGGQAQDRQWYDHVKSAQNRLIRKPLERLIRLTLLSKDGPTNGVLPDGWQLNFKSLWQMDEKTASAVRWNHAQADQVYIEQGVFTPQEVAKSRAAGNEPGADVVLDEDMRQKLADIPPEPDWYEA